MPLIRKSPGTAAAPPAPAVPATPSGTSTDDRWAAARALAAQGDVPALALALASERNLRVREAILTGLAKIATPDCADAVLPYLRSDDSVVRTGALDALRAMPGAVKPRLGTLLRDADADVRLLACEIVRNLEAAYAEEMLCALLATESEGNVCGAAVEVLAEVGSARSIPVLARLAERFPGDEFLNFAITVATERLRARSAP
jgi:HEAT repeat protein